MWRTKSKYFFFFFYLTNIDNHPPLFPTETHGLGTRWEARVRKEREKDRVGQGEREERQKRGRESKGDKKGGEKGKGEKRKE